MYDSNYYFKNKIEKAPKHTIIDQLEITSKIITIIMRSMLKSMRRSTLYPPGAPSAACGASVCQTQGRFWGVQSDYC